MAHLSYCHKKLLSDPASFLHFHFGIIFVVYHFAHNSLSTHKELAQTSLNNIHYLKTFPFEEDTFDVTPQTAAYHYNTP
jgi:hypothetical protein